MGVGIIYNSTLFAFDHARSFISLFFILREIQQGIHYNVSVQVMILNGRIVRRHDVKIPINKKYLPIFVYSIYIHSSFIFFCCNYITFGADFDFLFFM